MKTHFYRKTEMEIIAAIVGFIMGISLMIANNLPTWLLWILTIAFSGFAMMTYRSIYPISDGYYTRGHPNLGTLILTMVAYIFGDALLINYGLGFTLTWQSVLTVSGFGLAAVIVTWVALNVRHIAVIRATIYKASDRIATSLNELKDLNILYTAEFMLQLSDKSVREFTNLKYRGLQPVHDQHRKRVINIINHTGNMLVDYEAEQLTRTRENPPMFDNSFSGYYSVYDRGQEETNIEAAWLHSLHTNTVQPSFIALVRNGLKLYPGYFKRSLMIIFLCWPIVLMRFVLGDFLESLKANFYRISTAIMNRFSGLFVSRM
jgi:hypothetical protein